MSKVARIAKRTEYRFPRPDDAWVHVTEWGSPQPDVTIVLAHGWTLSSQCWEDVAELLVAADQTLRVIAYDHRGHGKSAKSVASLEILADDLAALVEAVAPVGPIVFGGHSMGGMTVMALAERHPQLVAERVVGVAFVSTAAGNLMGQYRTLPGFRRVAAAVLAVSARVKVPSRPLFLARQGTRRGLFGARPRRHDMNRAVLQAAQANPRCVAALGGSILEHERHSLLSTFDGLEVVVMTGSRDRLTTVEHARRIGQHVARSRVLVFRDSGHYLPYERREEVTAQLLGMATKARVAVPDWAGAAG